MNDKGQPDGSGGEGGKGDQVIKVGDKEYSADDVSNLIANTQTLTEKGEKLQPILDACARYDMDPAEFLDQATGGLSVISNLIQEGIIDAEGRVVKAAPKKKDDDDDLNLDDDLKGKKKAAPRKGDEVILKAIEGMKGSVDDYGKKITRLENIQTTMIHDRYRERIQKKFPDLDDSDADRAIALATNEGKKDVFEYADDVSKAKASSVEKIEKAYATKHGLDYDKLKETDENKLKEQEPAGGGAPRLKGKKIKFNASGKDEVTPFEAASTYLEKQTGGD